jgi:hypothetical protein
MEIEQQGFASGENAADLANMLAPLSATAFTLFDAGSAVA